MINIFCLACVKLAIGLENFKGVFARKYATSDDLSFATVQPVPGSLSVVGDERKKKNKREKRLSRPLSFFSLARHFRSEQASFS